MIYGSVCSGIEAATVAWHSLGWRPAFFAEIEKFPSAVLAHHYPTVPNHGDMTRFQEWPDAALDVLVGGTPCQSFSVAGLRKGLDDPRGNLMLTFGAIARRYRPTWLVWENVPGVLSSNGGRDLGTFLGMLGQLGYGFAYRVLDAQYFGVAQRRRRVFVVGHLGDWRRAAAVLFERYSLSGHPAPRREAREGAPGGAARSVAIRGRDGIPQAELGDEVANALLTPSGGRAGIGIGAVLTGIPGCFDALPFDTTQITSAANYSSPKSGDPCHPLAAGAHAPCIAFKSGQSEAAGGVFVTEEYAPTLQAQNNGSTAVPAVAFQSSQSGVRTDEVHATLDSNNGSRRHNGALIGLAVRRLTPRECERLQGFPDDYTLLPGKAADGPRYKALGNSMAVPVMRWIGERIQQVEAIVGQERAA